MRLDRLRAAPLGWVGLALSALGLLVCLVHGRGGAFGVAVVFGTLIFVGELARVTLRGDRVVAPVALAAALGYALLLDVGTRAAEPAVYQVLAVQGVAAGLAAAVHALVGRPSNVEVVGRQVIAVGAAAVAYRGLLLHVTLGPQPAHSQLLVPVMVVAVVVAGCADLGLAALSRGWRTGTPIVAGISDEVQARAGLGAAVAATGVLIALAATLLGWYALPVLVLPLLTTQFSFRRYAQIRSTYRQTIRALSKITEVGGYVEDGHSVRVAALAVATGRELGLTETALQELEYAALMHDIGQLSLAEPISRGSTLLVPPIERQRIAELGAEIIRSSGTLDGVAEIVARQADPYRRSRHPADETLPVASRVIKATSAFDDLVSVAPADPRCRADALERLRLGMAYEYDPRVVEALARVVAADDGDVPGGGGGGVGGVGGGGAADGGPAGTLAGTRRVG